MGDQITENVLDSIIDIIRPGILRFLENEGISFSEDAVTMNKDTIVQDSITVLGQVKGKEACFDELKTDCLIGDMIVVKDNILCDVDLNLDHQVNGSTACFDNYQVDTLTSKNGNLDIVNDLTVTENTVGSTGCFTDLAINTLDSTTNITINANLNFDGNCITGITGPILSLDPVNKMYTDSVAAGLDPKMSVRVCASTNINLNSAPLTIDSIVLNSGDRVLIKGQTDLKENGIYLFQGPGNPMIRAPDQDGTPANEVSAGNYTFVEEGTFGGIGFTVVGMGILTPGIDDIVWISFSPIGPQGPQGEVGPLGFQGTTGYQGPLGLQGPIGFQGEIGPQGLTGFQGNQGEIGPQGLGGPQGFRGFIGPTGFQGLQGPSDIEKIVINHTGSDTDSGTNLITSLSNISDNSVSKKYVLLLEPGVYDVGILIITMKSYVSINGCDKLSSIITSNASGTAMDFTGVTGSTLSNVNMQKTDGSRIVTLSSSSEICFENVIFNWNSAYSGGPIASHILGQFDNSVIKHCDLIQNTPVASDMDMISLISNDINLIDLNLKYPIFESSGLDINGFNLGGTGINIEDCHVDIGATGSVNTALVTATSSTVITVDRSVLLTSNGSVNQYLFDSFGATVNLANSQLGITGSTPSKQVNCYDETFTALTDI